MNVKFITLGCKVNQYETEAMRELLIKKGYTEDDNAPIDILIVNSCTVTGEGDKKTAKLFERAKRENPGCITVLTGCFPQAFPEKAGKFGADIITGTNNRKNLPELLEKAVKDRLKIVEIGEHKPREKFEELEVTSFEGHSRAFMKIQDGCDRFCSYCIIPYARGHLRSKSLESIEKSAEALAENGYSEIVLTGINLSFYGAGDGCDLGDAVISAAKPRKIKRIRLGSLQPDLIDKKIIEKWKKTDKLCPQFHLSLQSGSDGVLKRMNRRYTTDLYERVCTLLRENFPGAAITTDIIVGFPGETDEEFQETLDFVRWIRFSKIHVFPYSIRSGTPAAEMDCQVPESVKNLRKKRLISVAEEVRNQEMENLVGTAVRVLVENGVKDGKSEGYSENYTPVLFENKLHHEGEIVKVMITDVGNGYAEGYIME